MSLPTLRTIAFILGIFLITLAISMLLPLLTLLIYSRTDDLNAFLWSSLVTAIAGIAKMNYYKFFTANFVGAVLWGVGLTVAGYFTYSIEWVRSFVYIIALVVIGLSIIAGVRTWRANRNS